MSKKWEVGSSIKLEEHTEEIDGIISKLVEACQREQVYPQTSETSIHEKWQMFIGLAKNADLGVSAAILDIALKQAQLNKIYKDYSILGSDAPARAKNDPKSVMFDMLRLWLQKLEGAVAATKKKPDFPPMPFLSTDMQTEVKTGLGAASVFYVEVADSVYKEFAADLKKGCCMKDDGSRGWGLKSTTYNALIEEAKTSIMVDANKDLKAKISAFKSALSV